MKKKVFVIVLSLLVVICSSVIDAKGQNSSILSDDVWLLDVGATGQKCGASSIKIGIDPNRQVFPYSSSQPDFTVQLKVKGDTEYYSKDLRTPGSAQEVWELEVMVAGTDRGGSADIDLPGFFPLLTWDPNKIGPAKVMDLRLGDANGPVLLDMRTATVYPTKEADILNPSVNYIPDEDFALFSYFIVFEPISTVPVYYKDADDDGSGDPNDWIQTEVQPPDYVPDSGDCDDTDPNTFTGAPELCDGKDNNCDRLLPVDELDFDGDGFRECDGDCDNYDNTIYPGATEICDGKDNDCNEVTDDPSALTYSTYYRDGDKDGHGDPTNSLSGCKQPVGYVSDSTDCDDTDVATYPGATEICDGNDNNCDETIPADEADADSDGFMICENDCDDTDPAINPNAPELCDDKDNDCNEITDDPNVLTYEDYYHDADEDGYGDPNDSQNECVQPAGYILDSTDCDDTDPNTSPAATEVYDGIDNNCDGEPDELWYFVGNLIATGQELAGQTQRVYVTFGLDWGLAGTLDDPNNWADNMVRLQLIDEPAVADPNNLVDSDYLISDIRDALGQTTIAWYVLVEIGDEADPNQPDYYPLLSWDTNSLGYTEVDGKEYVYQLISGLGENGTVLVADMTDTNSYQTVSQDGDPIQYFTILWTHKPIPPSPPPKKSQQIFPWPGTNPRALGWVGAPFSFGFPGGLPYSMTSGYAPGLSIASFPGTYPGFTYPGWIYPSWTSYVPRFPATFPTLGIFSPVGQYGWPKNYWTGFPQPSYYKTGWFYQYR